MFRSILVKLLKPKGKIGFLSNIKKFKNILDIGCGNNSVLTIKKHFKDIYYTGVDVKNFESISPEYSLNKISHSLIDKHILCEPENFAKTIENIQNLQDIVISSHNIEHCFEREKVLAAMLKKISSGGSLYLSFPCSDSVNFPKRKGCLNYYDGDDHLGIPPDFDEIIKTLKSKNFQITFATKRYRPIILLIIGLILEPLSFFLKKRFIGTWELYGFESIIHAKKMV